MEELEEWQWGAVLLGLVTALPHMVAASSHLRCCTNCAPTPSSQAVHQEKRHLWVEEDERLAKSGGGGGGRAGKKSNPLAGRQRDGS